MSNQPSSKERLHDILEGALEDARVSLGVGVSSLLRHLEKIEAEKADLAARLVLMQDRAFKAERALAAASQYENLEGGDQRCRKCGRVDGPGNMCFRVGHLPAPEQEPE